MKNTPEIVTSFLQEFGSLIITDTTFKIVGISESALATLNLPKNKVLGTHLQLFFTHLFDGDRDQFLKILGDLRDHIIPRQVLSKKINGKNYYFKFSTYKDLVYIEWEEQIKKHLSSSAMNELGFLFDQSYSSDWKNVCSALQNLLHVDRVFVLQVQQTGHSKVLAEHTSNGIPTYQNKEFSHNFLPSEILSYYKSLSYRYIPDLKKQNQKLYTLDTPLSILSSQLAPIPPLHQLYLQDIGVKASLFFPLCLNGEFWGLVIAHHHKKKKVDLQQRKLCTFIIQSAMSRHENAIKQNLLDFNQQIHDAEIQLKEDLAATKTVNCAMVQNLSLLTEMCKADGLAIYNQGDLFFYGHCPKKEQFYEIIQYLQNNIDKTIFKDYNFRLNHGKNISSKLFFAGLLAYTIGRDKDYYIVWFRKETITSVVQMEITAESLFTTSGKIKNTLRTWEKPIKDSAMPWDESDINFVLSLQRIINESIINKAKEKQLLTDELRSKNNELEMLTFSLSHDLKNPLSVLKMGVKFLSSSGHNLSKDKINAWYKNLEGSILNIEEIIDNIITISQSKTLSLSKDPIPMSYTIRKITQDAIMLYQVEKCKVYYGTLHPLWGEKSALYQIFLNLISNAVKYTSDKKQPRIWIDSSLNEAEVCYTIKDNGIGIPEGILPQIFGMFTRAPNAQIFQGSGIGLSLVKRIMERLGGKIEITSQEGKGSVIHLYFPLVSNFPTSMIE